MNRWVLRGVLIMVVATLVAAILPGIREWIATRSFKLLSVPDRGSLVVAAAVAIAMTRLFVTIDRRARALEGGG